MGKRAFGLLLLVSWLPVSASSAQSSAGLDVNEGVVSKNELPQAKISEELVVLNVPHIRQKPGYCVPTSCAMILRYFGESESPGTLKKLAENHKPAAERNTVFTYWADMQLALKSKGKQWRIESFPKTGDGYQQGFEAIKTSLRDGLPVMIEVHLGEGHTFVVIGFDEKQQRVFIRDPWLPANKARILTCEQIQSYWHDHKYSETRSAFFPKRDEAKKPE